MMYFENPLWLTGLLIIPVLIIYNHHYSRKKSLQALEFSGLSVAKAAHLATKSRKLPEIIFALGLIAVALIFMGLADPTIPLDQTKDGVNIVLAIDVSGSMKAGDYDPDRITAAKAASEDLINQLDPKDYIGIVTFASGAMSYAYLSPDRERVIQKLQRLDAEDGSTAIGDGLALAVDMATSVPNRKNVIVLISDGECNSGHITPEIASEFAKESGVQVFTVAMGSEEPVLVGYDWASNPEYASVDEESLKAIAETTSGELFRSVDEKTLDNIYSKLNDKIVREKERTPVGWIFFLSAGIILITEYLIRYGRWRITL